MIWRPCLDDGQKPFAACPVPWIRFTLGAAVTSFAELLEFHRYTVGDADNEAARKLRSDRARSSKPSREVATMDGIRLTPEFRNVRRQITASG